MATVYPIGIVYGTVGAPGATAQFRPNNTTTYFLLIGLPPRLTYNLDDVTSINTSSTEAATGIVVPRAGIIRNLAVSLQTAPGGAVSVTWTVRANGTNTALAATITGTATSGTSATPVAVSAGDRLTVQHATSGGTPAASNSGRLIFEFWPDTGWATLRRKTAHANFLFAMYDQSGAPKTGLAVAAQRSLDGAAFATCANAVTEVGNGVYKIDLAAADLDAVNVMLRFSASGAVDTLIGVKTID
jgi:hypothetical protein